MRVRRTIAAMICAMALIVAAQSAAVANWTFFYSGSPYANQTKYSGDWIDHTGRSNDLSGGSSYTRWVSGAPLGTIQSNGDIIHSGYSTQWNKQITCWWSGGSGTRLMTCEYFRV